jgi:saccharopine dehydrogenase-like NADP-dependent oxidoreductase
MSRVLVVGAGPALGSVVAGLIDRGLDVATAQGCGAMGEPGELQADLAISLLPSAEATPLIQAFAQAGRPVVSVCPLEREAAEAGEQPELTTPTLISDLSLESGLVRISLANTVAGIRSRNGRLDSVRSYVGHLPAPETVDNPLGHKLASDAGEELSRLREPGAYREAGRRVEVPALRALRHVHVVEIEGHGDFEAYPLGDSALTLGSADVAEASTLFHGALRGMGWCDTLYQFGRLGLLSLEPVATRAGTYGELLRVLLGCSAAEDLASAAARKLGLSKDSSAVWSLQWLGLLSQRRLPEARVSPLEALARVMNERLRLRPGERDRLILRHEVVASMPGGTKERHVVELVEYGSNDGQTARERLVALPTVVAASLLLEGEIRVAGRLRATDPGVREPLLESLARHGLAFHETVEEF